MREMAEARMNEEEQKAYETALARIEECRLKGRQGTELDLSDLGLTRLPEAVGNLTALTRLDLRSNQLAELPEVVGNLTALTRLDLGSNQLAELPEVVGNLTALTWLNLSLNQLAELPEAVGNLTALTWLNLSLNQLAELPEAVGNLTALTQLHLSNNQLTELPEAVGNLTALTWLDLFDNQLTELPEAVGNLTALTWLNLWNNQLTELPEAVGNLTALTWLFLWNNQLTELPEAVGNLTALTQLYLSSNQLEELPEAVGNLTALTQLYLSSNQLAELPEAVGNLTALTHLDLSSNKLTELPEAVGNLTALTWLNLSSNQLAELPDWIWELKGLEQLYLHDNPRLGLASEVLGPTWEEVINEKRKAAPPGAILRAYFALKRGSRPLNEVKLVLIGRGNVGKSSLVRALKGEPFDETLKETPGIAIGAWELECHGTPIKVHIWDFAGQEITHEAHRFFLTERCLYLVVTEGREGRQDEDLDHWLAHVEQYGAHREAGKPAEHSPALVVANKVDQSACPLERRRLRREHPSARWFLETDCKTGRGIAELKAKICEVLASSEMEAVRQPFPTEWWKIKGALEDWKSLKRPFFSYAEFREECAKHGVRGEDQEAVTYVLNQLGIALYYGHNPRLRDTRVLDPQWLVNGMYALIRGVEKQGEARTPGELRKGEIGLRLGAGLALIGGGMTIADYPSDTREFLVELMEDRELCFVNREAGDGETLYLLPGLLSKDEPEGFDIDGFLRPDGQETRFRFSYVILPDGLIPRFITRTHLLSAELPRWRQGVVLRWGGSDGAPGEPARAVVLADPRKKQIEVVVRDGTPGARQELAGIIRTHLKRIHAELPKALEPKEELELSMAGEQWESVNKLEMVARENRSVQVVVGGKLEEHPPGPELEKMEPESAWREGAGGRALRVFVSYSHKDSGLRQALTATYLAVLENEKKIETWWDGMIRAGMDWDKEIRQGMREADIVIFLLSEDFFASKYIQGVEVAMAKERHAKGEVEILPVWLSGESWKEDDWFKGLQMAPKRASDGSLRKVIDHNPRCRAWEAVQRELREMIKRVVAKRGGSPGGGKGRA